MDTHTENYKIIADEAKLIDFIDWLPELLDDEFFYVSLLSRKKYDSTKQLKADKGQLKRFTSRKNFLIEKLRQLECKEGTFKHDGINVTNETMVAYITVNPRSNRRAAIQMLKDMADAVGDWNEKCPSIEKIALSCIQKAGGSKHYIDFDFDGIELDSIIDKIKDAVNLDAVTVIKTRGGLHVLIKVEAVENKYRKSFYPKILAIEGCDQANRDSLLPIVGCYQGGFVPHFIDLKEYM